MNLTQVIQQYGEIECNFVYFDGNRMAFDFMGIDENENVVRISIGGAPEYLQYIAFHADDCALTIQQALERHIRYLSVTNSRGVDVFEKFFEIQKANHA